MSLFGLPQLILGLLVLGAFILIIVLVAIGRRGTIPVNREWRLVQATRAVGIVGGVVAAFVVSDLGRFGIGTMLAPAVLGLCVVAAVAIGETVVRPPRPSGLRTASLTPRRLTTYVPRVSVRLVGGMAIALGVSLAFTTATASRDETLGGWRQVACHTDTFASAAGPYPGGYYSLPLTGLLALVLLIAAIAGRQVVTRPRGMAATDGDDDLLRRRSLTVIVSAVGVAVCFSHAGIALASAKALSNLSSRTPSCDPGWMTPVSIVLGVSAAVGLFIGVWSLGRVIRNDVLGPVSHDAHPQAGESVGS